MYQKSNQSGIMIKYQKITRSGSMGFVWVRIKEGADLKKAGDQLITQMAQLKNKPKEIYNAREINTGIFTAADSLSRTNIFVSLIAAISLVVGGIGIMNIMLVTITERQSEIGIRKAIGASNFDIMYQFLAEAAILTFLGGFIGIIAGILGSYIAGYFTSIPPSLNYKAVAGSVMVSVLIGIIFGLYPARKASILNPIDALRHE